MCSRKKAVPVSYIEEQCSLCFSLEINGQNMKVIQKKFMTPSGLPLIDLYLFSIF